MDFVRSFVADTALVPVIVSAIVAAALFSVKRFARCSGAVALACGFFAGWASQDWATLTPARYLDWLPYCAAALGLVAVAAAIGLPRWAFLSLGIVCCIAATWLLVPSFPKLQPPRFQAIAMIAGTSAAMFILLEQLTKQIGTRTLIACLMVTGTAAALVLQQSFGMKFAQIMGMLTASLAGAFLFARNKPDETSMGVPLIFTTLVANLMFIGNANSTSDVPVYSFAVVPCIPAALWLVASANRKDNRTWLKLAGFALFGLLIVSAVYPAIMAHPPWEDMEH
ncbi:MAG: hypothetical protein WBH28_24450 [Fuerstiella sp.]